MLVAQRGTIWIPSIPEREEKKEKKKKTDEAKTNAQKNKHNTIVTAMGTPLQELSGYVSPRCGWT